MRSSGWDRPVQSSTSSDTTQATFSDPFRPTPLSFGNPLGLGSGDNSAKKADNATIIDDGWAATTLPPTRHPQPHNDLFRDTSLLSAPQRQATSAGIGLTGPPGLERGASSGFVAPRAPIGRPGSKLGGDGFAPVQQPSTNLPSHSHAYSNASAPGHAPFEVATGHIGFESIGAAMPFTSGPGQQRRPSAAC